MTQSPPNNLTGITLDNNGRIPAFVMPVIAMGLSGISKMEEWHDMENKTMVDIYVPKVVQTALTKIAKESGINQAHLESEILSAFVEAGIMLYLQMIKKDMPEMFDIADEIVNDQIKKAREASCNEPN